jgi:arylsulfatase A-like enzyme
MGEGEYGYAVRHGDLKLVDSRYKNRQMLFDLARDPWEINDLSGDRPEDVARLDHLIRTWNEANVAPGWPDGHGENVRKEEQTRQAIVSAASRGDTRAAKP